MAKAACYICGKTLSSGNNVSHSNRKTKRRWRANIQKARIKVGKSILSVRVCTRCIKGNLLMKA